MQTEAARPSTVNRAIDLDLETIALLALHKDRARRYQTAGVLASTCADI